MSLNPNDRYSIFESLTSNCCQMSRLIKGLEKANSTCHGHAHPCLNLNRFCQPISQECWAGRSYHITDPFYLGTLKGLKFSRYYTSIYTHNLPGIIQCVACSLTSQCKNSAHSFQQLLTFYLYPRNPILLDDVLRRPIHAITSVASSLRCAIDSHTRNAH